MTDIPRILGGRYEVGDLIGRGGMAQVHIGYDTRLSRTVAIKVLRADLAADPTFLARFRREAQSAAALNHPAIVAVYDTSEEHVTTAAGRSLALPYIVMEYVRGSTVSKLLSNGQALPIDEAVQVVAGVLSALEYSHQEGIIHRDIKPGNIMMTQDGKVKVMDFGIARAIADSAATMTSTNSVVGTAQYLSPEQARGEVVDTRSDLYSTGCLLYELLTGKPPFQGDSAVAVAYQHVSEMPKPASQIAPDIPDAIDRVVMKSLAKKREDRYQNAAEMRLELLRAARGGAVLAPDVDTWQTRVVPTPPRPSDATTVAPAYVPPTAVAAAHTQTGMTPVATENEPAKKSKAWIIVLAVFLFLLAAAGITYALTRDNNTETTPTPAVVKVDVPDLANADQAEARKTLEKAGLKFVLGDPVNDDKIPVGRFVSSDPAAGTSVDKDTKVTVHFSAGPGSVTVPTLNTGSVTEEQARAELEKLGLVVGSVETTNQAGKAKGIVVDTEPSAGSSVAKGTAIHLYVASGKIELPNLVGKTQEDALNTLSALRLNSSVKSVASDLPKNTVIKQEPLAGPIDVSTTVKLEISDGPAPTPAPAPKPDPNPNPTPNPTPNPPTNNNGK
ncbi:Stk1 family PASTA domain-containing Ser/Thr kinase [Arcanobacterium bovis]|uniref:non-specific serine/threonine protein kinase n=1 Tax=Arcanobacterium bovis TaxID=2529275 RepID=A0A4Q9V0N7_9ACTO|nr:Stk1 family PASTA domain-containing Ser/Thr kinase [Arcanobacterium bovis]TBW21045.1 Stk1 family PASTA domain-containing Ser/Thr kinase [Arcanobacterium bovis]